MFPSLPNSMDHGKTWQPFQYYSAECRAVFGRHQRTPISRANEQEPLCLNEYTEKASTRIAFSTLADQPSAQDFENNPVLSENWHFDSCFVLKAKRNPSVCYYY